MIKQTRTFKETRKLDSDRLRSLCIRESFYDLGTNREYFELFDMIPKNNVTALDIYKLACNIYDHTDMMKKYGRHDKNECLENLMHLIGEVCYTFFEVHEDVEYIDD